ncbi:hypothetical protein EJ08DRAFT_594836, partial [Tothia fuscella]
SIPWCANLINNPNYSTTATSSRIAKGSTEDSFFPETLQAERTIRKCLTLNSRPNKSLDPPIQEACTFFELGNGLNGFPNISHGGFVATLLDEEMGILLTVNQELVNKESKTHEEITYMTAYLNVSYKAPVKTPGIVLVEAKVVKNKNRKIFVRGAVKDEFGKELAVGEGLFIKLESDPRAKL